MYIKKGLDSYVKLLNEALATVQESDIDHLLSFLVKAKERRKVVFVIGNGGSQANAQHLVLHLRENGIKSYDLLADNSALTAVSNDLLYADVPAEFLHTLASMGDVLFVITGSGNSQNVLNAQSTATKLGMFCIGLLGFDGGKSKNRCHAQVHVRSTYYGPIEDSHSAIIHLLAENLKLVG